MTFILKHKYTIALSLILVVGLALRINLAQDDFLHKWDERFHALVAKNLLMHPLKPTLYEEPALPYDYRLWYANHIWLHKQPLPLWFIAASYKVFGVAEFATRIPSLIFSVLSIIITYLLASKLFNKRIGILSAFFIAINGLIIEMAAGRIATDHYDTLFLVFIEIAILFAYYNSVKQKIVYSLLSGLFIGLALLTKWLPGLIVLPIHFCFLLHFKAPLKICFKQIIASLLTCVLFSLPWQIFILTNYPVESKWEYFHNWLHISTELDGQTGGILYYVDKVRINYSEIIYLPLLFLLYKLFKVRFKDYKRLALFIWIFIPIIFFSFAKTKMQGYILFISPALFIITADFFFELKERINTKKNKFLMVMAWLLLFGILILPIRYCYERTGFGLKKVIPETYQCNYKSLKYNIPEKAVVLNVAEPVEFMFYNNCIAYSNSALNENVMAQIKAKGYSILYYNPAENSLNEGK